MARFFGLLLFSGFAFGLAGIAAAADWQVTQLNPPGSVNSSAKLRPALSCTDAGCTQSEAYPFANEGSPAPDGLPDGKIVASDQFSDINQAWYILPTRRYGHGILGDALEAGGLAVKTKAGRIIRLPLPEDQVFEDRTPRLVDLDGDGTAEIVTILTSTTKGASIAVFNLRGYKLQLRAKTDFIGISNRWLNIAGFADFNGDGSTDIAGVWTPHIGGTLKFWTLNNDRLEQVGSIEGFSNHYIDSREQRLSAIGDVDGNGTPDLVLPSANRSELRMAGFVQGQLQELANVRLDERIDKAIAIYGAGMVITLGLADGSVVAVGH